MLKTLIQAYHQHAVGVRRVGTYLGAGLMVAAMVLGALPELGVSHLVVELLAWAGGALGGAVLFPAASRALRKWLAGGGGVLLVVAAQWLVTSWPASQAVGFLAAVLMGLGGLAKTAAWVTAPDVARASLAPPAPSTDDDTPVHRHKAPAPPEPRQ